MVPIEIETFLDVELRHRERYTVSESLTRREIYIDSWPIIWQRIADMQSLQKIDVHILSGYGLYHLSHEDEVALLNPLCALERPKHFEVRVSWYLADGQPSLQNTPLTLKHGCC